MFADLEGFIFYVTELAAGRDFYLRVLQLPILKETESRIEFHIPRSRLTLIRDADGSEPNCDNVDKCTADNPKRCALALLVEDIDTSVFHLHRCGVKFLTPIEERGGLWMCEIADPYGNRIAIAQLNEIRI